MRCQFGNLVFQLLAVNLIAGNRGQEIVLAVKIIGWAHGVYPIKIVLYKHTLKLCNSQYNILIININKGTNKHPYDA